MGKSVSQLNLCYSKTFTTKNNRNDARLRSPIPLFQGRSKSGTFYITRNRVVTRLLWSAASDTEAMESSKQALQNTDLEQLNDKDKAELRQFLANEQQRSQIQSREHNLRFCRAQREAALGNRGKQGS